MGNSECCVERDPSSGELRTKAVQLHPASTKPVDGAYVPLIRYWDPYVGFAEVIEQKLTLWPEKTPLGERACGHKWDARSKVIYEFFHLSDVDDDLFIEWENGEIRAVCRRMFVFDELPEPQMNEQAWVATFRQFERDDRNLLAFAEVCLFIKFLYQTLRDLASGKAHPVEIAPNVFLAEHPTSKVFDKTPKLDELELARKLFQEAYVRHLEMLQKRHKVEQELTAIQRARAEKERKKAEVERLKAVKKRQETETALKRNKENEANRLREADEKRKDELNQRDRAQELLCSNSNGRKTSDEVIITAQLEAKKLADESKIAHLKAQQTKCDADRARRVAKEAEKNEKRMKGEEEQKRREEDRAKKQEENSKRQYLLETYNLKAMAEDKVVVKHETILETSERWYEDFEMHIDVIYHKVSTWDDDYLYDTLRKLFQVVDRDKDGYLYWNNSEIRNFVKSVFAEHGLPVPELSETQWNLAYKKFDADNRFSMDLREAATFVKHVYEEAIATASEHVHNLPQMYKKHHRSIIENKLNAWDEMSTQAIVEKLFQDVDCDNTGRLEWNNSEIRNFVRLVFEANGFPLPRMSETTWYQLYREVDKDGHYAQNLPEAISFAKHVHSRVLHFYPKPQC